MTAVDTPRETKRKKGQPVRGTKQIRRRLPGYPRFRIASGVRTEADFDRCDDAVQAAAAAGRRDWLDALLRGQREPIELANALRDAKGRAAQLPEPNVTPFTKEVVEAWLERVRNRYAPKSLQMMRRTLVSLTGTKMPVKGPKGIFRVAPNWTDRMDQLPEVMRLERDRYADLQAYVSFELVKARVTAFVKDLLGKGHPIYRDIVDIGSFSEKEKRAAPRRRRIQNLPIDAALTFADRLLPEERQPWLDTLLTGANPKELWDDGMTFDLETGHIFDDGQKRRARKRKLPLIALRWRGKTYKVSLTRPTISYKAYADRLRENYGGFAQAYDARRSYSRYLEDAGLPHLVVKTYMGHGPASETEKYIMADGKYAQDKASLTTYGAKLTAWLQEQLRLTDERELTDKLPNTALSLG